MTKTIQFTGIHNFRDMGGVPTKDGKRVKRNLLYRSGQLSTATPEDIAQLKNLHLTTILDYRDESEANAQPDPQIEGTQNIRIGALKTKSAIRVDEMQRLAMNGEFEKILEDYQSMYVVMPFQNPAYQKLVELLLTSKGPILHHCTAGKDRTGIGALIIYLLLGVSEEEIMKDYLLTNEENRKNPPKWLLYLQEKFKDDALLKKFAGVQEDLLKKVFATIKDKYGNYEEYFAKEFNIGPKEIEQIRAYYLEN